MVFRLLENVFVGRKNESRHFYSSPPLHGKNFLQVLTIAPPPPSPHRQRKIIHPLTGSVFQKSILPAEKE